MSVSDALSRSFLDIDVEFGVENGKLMAFLAAKGEVLSRTYHGERVTIHCRLAEKYVGRISPEEATIHRRSQQKRKGEEPGAIEEVA